MVVVSALTVALELEEVHVGKSKDYIGTQIYTIYIFAPFLLYAAHFRKSNKPKNISHHILSVIHREIYF